MGKGPIGLYQAWRVEQSSWYHLGAGEMSDSSNSPWSWLISLFIKNVLWRLLRALLSISLYHTVSWSSFLFFLSFFSSLRLLQPSASISLALLLSWAGFSSGSGHPPPPLFAPLANERSKTLQWLMSSRLWDPSVKPPHPPLPLPLLALFHLLISHNTT